MLISTEHEIQLLIKTKITTIKKFLALSLSDVVFIMLINGKMPTIAGIFTFMSKINFVSEKSFITSGPGLWQIAWFNKCQNNFAFLFETDTILELYTDAEIT